jgi:hypothetical protein
VYAFMIAGAMPELTRRSNPPARNHRPDLAAGGMLRKAVTDGLKLAFSP